MYGTFERVKSGMDLSVRMKIILFGDKTGNVFYQIIDTLSRGISVWVGSGDPDPSVDRVRRVTVGFAKETAPVDDRLRAME